MQRSFEGLGKVLKNTIYKRLEHYLNPAPVEAVLQQLPVQALQAQQLNLSARESVANVSGVSQTKSTLKEIRTNLIEMQTSNGEKLRETNVKVEAIQQQL